MLAPVICGSSGDGKASPSGRGEGHRKRVQGEEHHPMCKWMIPALLKLVHAVRVSF